MDKLQIKLTTTKIFDIFKRIIKEMEHIKIEIREIKNIARKIESYDKNQKYCNYIIYYQQWEKKYIYQQKG